MISSTALRLQRYEQRAQAYTNVMREATKAATPHTTTAAVPRLDPVPGPVVFPGMFYGACIRLRELLALPRDVQSIFPVPQILFKAIGSASAGSEDVET